MPPCPTWSLRPGSGGWPLVIAHRGDSVNAPENTLVAFRRAVEIGADGVELDVRLTRDRQVAVIHDRTLDRTTNGRGPVGKVPAEALQNLDAGSWFHPSYAEARIPLLDEVLDEMPGGFLLNVEMKVRGTGVLPLAGRVARLIRDRCRGASTLVASFNPLALMAMRVIAPEIPRGFIWSRSHPLPLRQRWLARLAAPQWMNPDRQSITLELVSHFHRAGRCVLVWDVDAAGGPREPILPVDAIVTDDPGRFARRRGPGL